MIKNTKGSFTIESSLIFPLIFGLTLITVFAALLVYQQVHLLYIASVTAERTAYSWVESENTSNTTVEIPSREDDFAGPALVLQQSVQHIPEHITGHIEYVNHIVDRKIVVHLQSAMHVPVFARHWISNQVKVHAESRIVQPAEFIRTVDLVHYYASNLTDRGINERQANQALDTFLQKQSLVEFPYHREAHAYLKKLVNGREIRRTTTYGNRMIDAMDSNGIAHQAYLTFTERQLRQVQMVKDVELLHQDGLVNGVVWHFFRRTNQIGKVGPSAAFRAQLEANGIIVVIHD